MKNSLLDKSIYSYKRNCNAKYEEEDDPFIILEGQLFTGLIGLGFGAISGSVIGGIICPHLLIGYLSGGILASFLGAFGGIVNYQVYNDYSPGKESNSENYKLNTFIKTININNNGQIKEEIQKFVYFKDNKIIGFIKFKNNITPPVNGYYFKCDYTLKIDMEVSNNFKDNNQNVFKNKIDFYDGKKYIEKMKTLLNINNLLQGTNQHL